MMDKCFEKVVDFVDDLPFILECLKKENVDINQIADVIYEKQRKFLNENRITRRKQKKFLLENQIHKLIRDVRSDKYVFTERKDLNNFINNLSCGCYLFGIFSGYIPHIDDDIYVAVAGNMSVLRRIKNEGYFYVFVDKRLGNLFEKNCEKVKYASEMLKVNIPINILKFNINKENE